jgi:hypothetical protein
VKTILRHSDLAILDVDYVELIHVPQEPHLTLPSDVSPLKMDSGNHQHFVFGNQ